MTDLAKRIAELSPEKRELLLRRLKKSTEADKEQPKSKLPSVVPAPEERHKPFPLTDIQQAYWVGRSNSFELGDIACHIYWEIESQNLDLQRLQLALGRLIDRQEMLRAIILPDGRQQILEKLAPYEIRVLDLRGQGSNQASSQLEAVRSEMSHQVLPSDKAPMFDFRATLLNNRRVRLHLSLDVLMSDARSSEVLFDELHQFYANPEAALRPLDLSFRDYVLATANLKDSEIYLRSKEYWLARLSTLPPAPELPLAKNPSAVKQVRFGRRTARIGAENWRQLKGRAAKSGLTPSVLLLSAFSEVLGLWSKNPRFTINLTLFNRLPLHPQVNEIIGDFTSVTLLKVDTVGQPTFKSLARHLQQQLWNDMDHRYFGGVQVLREMAKKLGGHRGASMPVVFTSILSDQVDSVTPGLTAWMGDVIYQITQTPQVWLDNTVIEEAGSLVINWDAVEELFPAGLLDDMFDAYCRLLRRLTDEEDSWQEGRFDMASKLLPPAQVEQRKAVNATGSPISGELLHAPFFAQALHRTRQPAIITPTTTLTYKEVQNRANQIAHWLRENGACPNELVAVVMEKGWEQVVGVLGVLASGAAYLPIDATLPKERLAYVLDHGRVSLVLTQSWHDQNIEWPSSIQRLCVDQVDQLHLPANSLEPVQRTGDLAYVIYTSGSTGLPKGVVIDHRGAVNTILDINRRFQIKSEDRVLALSALNFDLSVYDIFGLLAAGGTIIIPDAFSERNPAHWAELIVEHGVTVWDTVPALMQMLVEYLEGRSEKLPKSLRLVMMSGDWVPVDLPDRIKALGEDIKVISLGGATEASIWSILYPIEGVNPLWTSIPYGKPMVNQTYHVLNEALMPCPVWVPGQLYIGGIGLAKGYWREEEKTRTSFITHPHSGERLYRTGDLGRYLPDGNIEFLGREDFQVKIRGHRIELGEIEANLLHHSGVQAAVMAAVGEARGNKRLVAYVVPNQRAATPDKTFSTRSQEKNDETEGFSQYLVDPVARLKFKIGKPGLRSDDEKSSIQLLRSEEDESLVNSYLSRRSFRKYADSTIPFERFSAFLNCLVQIAIEGAPFPKYRYASAGGIYPVQTYLYVKPGRVEGIASGAYYHHPITHRLTLLSSDVEINRSHFPKSQTIFDESAFALFLIGKLDAISPMYGDLARDFCLIEAGLICQLLETAAPEHRIGLCQIGGLDFSPIRRFFSLASDHTYLHCLLGGPVDGSQTSREAFLKSFDEFLPFLDYVGAEFTKTNEDVTSQGTSSPKLSVPSSAENDREFTEELKGFLRGKLPDYMVPASFMLLDSLPLSPNGKVDRKALPKPDQESMTLESEYMTPRTPTEMRLVEIWKEVLKLEQVGVNDNFFELGGHSILAIHMIFLIEKSIGIQVSPQVLLGAQTVARLAEELDKISVAQQHVS